MATKYYYEVIDGERVEVHAAQDLKKLKKAFKARFNMDLIVRSGVRTTEEQARLYKLYLEGKGNQAAPPGSSNHEENGPVGPRAVDLRDSGVSAGVTVRGTERANWLKTNARKYGFNPAGYGFDNVKGGQEEPWHYEYTGKVGGKLPTATASAGKNPFGIKDARGLEKIARTYDSKATVGGDWDKASASGFARFLRNKWGYVGDDTLGPNMWKAIARWLRTRWGYVGDDTPGPEMRKRLQVASTSNYKAL